MKKVRSKSTTSSKSSFGWIFGQIATARIVEERFIRSAGNIRQIKKKRLLIWSCARSNIADKEIIVDNWQSEGNFSDANVIASKFLKKGDVVASCLFNGYLLSRYLRVNMNCRESWVTK